MDIKTLESFKLSDAVTFHDELNPKLFHGQHLKHNVKEQLKVIAQDFLNELGIDGLDVKDIVISGSNAAYSYTPHSDLDLHILVDMAEFNNDEVYKELFDAKKTLYNDSHDITVYGIPIELYVQDAALPAVSLGEYSLLNDKWTRLPTKRRSNFDQTAAKSKYNKLEDLIKLGLKSKDIVRVNNLLKTIKRYRQSGLDKGGEFGPENLAFKAIRSQGYLTKLYALRDKLHSARLSIEGMYSQTTESYMNNKLIIEGNRSLPKWNTFVTHHYSPDQEPGIVILQYMMFLQESYITHTLPLNGNSIAQAICNLHDLDTQIELAKINTDLMEKFDSWNAIYEKLKRQGEVSFHREFTNSSISKLYEYRLAHGSVQTKKTKADNYNWEFKKSEMSRDEIREALDKQYHAIKNRIGFKLFPLGIHEIAENVYRTQKNLLLESNHTTLSEFATLIKKYDLRKKVNLNVGSTVSILQFVPHVYETPPVIDVLGHTSPKEIASIHYDETDKVEWIGFTDHTSFPDKHFLSSGKGGELLGLYTLFFPTERDAKHALLAATVVCPDGWEIYTKNLQENMSEDASGYIPSAKQKNDPRFKTALTVDVKPDTVKKNAKAFGFNVSRAGIPPLLRK